MTRILVVEADPVVGFVAAETFRCEPGAEVRCAHSAKEALQLIGTASFDFAFISMMKDNSGLALAECAANENIAVLLTSGNPATQKRLVQLGYPCLSKPYGVAALLLQTKEILEDSAHNIRTVKASVAKTVANAEGLRAAIEESRRLLAECRRLLDS